jgi:hypothetical protein
MVFGQIYSVKWFFDKLNQNHGLKSKGTENDFEFFQKRKKLCLLLYRSYFTDFKLFTIPNTRVKVISFNPTKLPSRAHDPFIFTNPFCSNLADDEFSLFAIRFPSALGNDNCF